MRLANQVIGSILIAMAPTLVVVVFLARQAVLVAHEKLEEPIIKTLDALSIDAQSYLDVRQREMELLAELPAARSLKFSELRPVLDSFLNTGTGAYERILLGLPNGNFYATNAGNPAFQGLVTVDDNAENTRTKSIGLQDFWQATMARGSEYGRTYISSLKRFPGSDEQYLVLSRAIRDEGRSVAMIAGFLPFSELQDRLLHKLLAIDEAVSSQHISLAVLSSTGRFSTISLGSASKENVWQDDSGVLTTSVANVQRGLKGIVHFENVGGERFVLAYSPLGESGLSLFLKKPEMHFHTDLDRTEINYLLLIVFLLVLAIVMAVSLARMLIRPLDRLVNTASLLTPENIDNQFKVESNQSSEVSKISSAIERLLAQLRREREASRKSEERFSLAMQGSMDGLWTGI